MKQGETVPVKRLSLVELETWKRKAQACDEALQYMSGQVDSEKLLNVQRILEEAAGEKRA